MAYNDNWAVEIRSIKDSTGTPARIMAELINKSRATIWNYYMGRTEPSVSDMETLRSLIDPTLSGTVKEST